MPVGLQPLLSHIPAWLMVLFRITGIFVIAPMFGSNTIPRQIKIFMAVGLSLCVYPMLLDADKPSAALLAPVLSSGIPLWALAGAVALELMIGIVIGYGASIPLMGMQIGGRICDQQMGMGLASIYNPELSEEGGIVSQFFFILSIMLFLALGGHRVLLSTLVGSFDSVPPGGFRVDGDLFELMLGLLDSMLSLAMRVAAPLLCLVFLQTVALGFVARTVPQMNILSIGFPLRILVGASVLITSLSALAIAFTDTMREALSEVSRFFGV
jgi:flagellar biosynthesis protein FliR